jgi:kynureninase
MTVDFARERQTFPLLAERAYFAQQCLGACPAEMLEDLRAYGASLARRSRAIPEWAERWEEMHRLVEDAIGAPRGAVFLRDTSTAAQAAIAAALEPSGERRRILVGGADFHSSRYLWSAQARRGFEVIEAEADVLDAIDERTRVVALSLVSPRTGAMIDAAAIAEKARRAGAIFVLDVYQAIGVVPIDVGKLGASAVVGGFHKWVGGGGTGLAFGYVEPVLAERLEPIYPGWMAHRDLMAFADRFEPARGAEKLQQGMPAMEPIYTTRAGLRWMAAIGVEAIRSRSLELTGRLRDRLSERGLAVITPREPARRGGMLCLDLPDAKRVVDRLAERSIDIDSRPGAGVRIGPHPCTTFEECDRLVDRLAEATR